MEKAPNSSTPSEASDTSSKPNMPNGGSSSISSRDQRKPVVGDGFFTARLRLTFYYTLFTAVIVGGFSLILYQTLLSNFAVALKDTAPGLSPHIFAAVIDKAQIMLANRLLMADAVILIFAIVFGYLLTDRTLKPIRESMHRQKRFIADASHELRTPIAVVISGLEVALRNKNLGIDQARQTLNETLEEMRDFSSMTNQLLDLSKHDIAKANDSHRSGYAPVEIAGILHATSSKMKNLADEKGIAFRIDVNPDLKVNVFGSETELSRVFYNIIHNAITYTEKGGTIVIDGHIHMGKYVATVTDTGIGMPSWTLGKIFEPFFQGDAARKRKGMGGNDGAKSGGGNGGAGLGLTISRKIVESHKGTIVIKSKERQGTKVVICLPISS